MQQQTTEALQAVQHLMEQNRQQMERQRDLQREGREEWDTGRYDRELGAENVHQERRELQQREQWHRHGQGEWQDRNTQQRRQPMSDWRREIEQGEQHRQLELGEGGQHRQLELGEMQQRQRRTRREMNEAEERDGEERRGNLPPQKQSMV